MTAPTANAPGLADLLPPGQVAKRIPGRPHPKTVLRWMLQGVEGPDGSRVRLQHVRAGRQRLTCERWLVEFFAAQTPAGDGGSPPQRAALEAERGSAPAASNQRRQATAARLAAARRTAKRGRR